MCFIVIHRDPDASLFSEQVTQQLQTRINQRKPLRVLQVVIVVLKGAPSVIRRVNEDALHPACVEREQRLQRIQVVPLDEHVFGVRVPIRVLRHCL